MIVLGTDRLVLRHLVHKDAPFVVELLNDPDWLRFIGDRNVRTLQQAADYLETGPVRMYAQHGFGLYLAEQKADGAPTGLCGLVKRDFLEDVDLGFAFLPRYRGAGYAFEAAAAVLRYAAGPLGLARVVAITAHDNVRSARLLEKLGFHFERMLPYPGEDEAVRLFAFTLVGTNEGGSPPPITS